MVREKENPYKKCPVYETDRFIVRMVQEGDAEDLLGCYSDPVSAKFFNSDNCTSDFAYKSLDEMKNCIRFWIAEYQQQYYIRFSIIDKENAKAIGTIEFFAKTQSYEDLGKVGVLRIDLASKYEKEGMIREILNMIHDNFYEVFEVENIVTKAIPEAKQRIMALQRNGYQELKENSIVSYDFYHIREK